MSASDEAFRPDLAPGESVTTVPDRWCEACATARGSRTCPICGARTIERTEDVDVAGQLATPPDTAEPDDVPPPRPAVVRPARRVLVELEDEPAPRTHVAPEERARRYFNPPPERYDDDRRARSRVLPLPRREAPMRQRRHNHVEMDELGREVHETGGRRGRTSPGEQVAKLWRSGTAPTEKWVAFACAALARGENTQDAGEIADEMMVELYLRQSQANG